MGKRALALGVVCCFALGCRAARHESAGWRFQFRPLETLADAVLEGFSHQARDEIERANGDNYRRYQKANRNSFEWNDSPTSGWIPSSDTAQPGADSW